MYETRAERNRKALKRKSIVKTVVIVSVATFALLIVAGAIGLIMDGDDAATVEKEEGTPGEQQVSDAFEPIATEQVAEPVEQGVAGDDAETNGDGETVNGYSVRFGTIKDAQEVQGDSGSTLVITAVIEPSYNDKATIEQNYFNIEDLVLEQGAAKFDEIRYMAQMEAYDGEYYKVVFFTVGADVIQAISSGNMVAIQLGDYVENLEIDSSLQD